MAVLDFNRAFSDPRNNVLGLLRLAAGAPLGAGRDFFLGKAQTEAAKLGLTPQQFAELRGLAPKISIDPRLSSQKTSLSATKARIQAENERLARIHQAALTGGDNLALTLADTGGVTSPIARAQAIEAILGGEPSVAFDAEKPVSFFRDPQKVADLARQRAEFEIKRFKQAHRGGPFSFIAPLAGGLFGLAIPGIAGGIIGGALAGANDGLEGVLKGATLGGLAKGVLPSIKAKLPSFSDLFGGSAANANAVPGLSTGVTTPAGGGAIVGTGAPGFGAGTAAKLTGLVGGAPLGASPLAVAGGALPLPGVTALPTGGQLPGTNIVVGSTGPQSIFDSALGLGKKIATDLGKTAAKSLFSNGEQRRQSSLSVSPSSDLGTPLARSVVPAVSALGLGGLTSGTSQPSSSPAPTSPTDSTAGQAALPVAASSGPVVETPPLQSAPGAGTRASRTNPSGVLVNPVVPNSIFKGSGLIFPSFA